MLGCIYYTERALCVFLRRQQAERGEGDAGDPPPLSRVEREQRDHHGHQDVLDAPAERHRDAVRAHQPPDVLLARRLAPRAQRRAGVGADRVGRPRGARALLRDREDGEDDEEVTAEEDAQVDEPSEGERAARERRRALQRAAAADEGFGRRVPAGRQRAREDGDAEVALAAEEEGAADLERLLE